VNQSTEKKKKKKKNKASVGLKIEISEKRYKMEGITLEGGSSKEGRDNNAMH